MRPELPILIKARAKIADPANWGRGIRGVYGARRPINTCCAAEAIEDICGDSPLRVAALLRLKRAIGIPDECMSLPLWNDAPERTHAEVLAAFDKAIASAS